MGLKNNIARIFFPYGKTRKVLYGPAKGLKFIVEPGIGVSFALGLDSLHYNFLSKKIQKGDIIFDIGANRGQTALVLASLTGSSGKVLAFEPVPREFKSLKKNIEINNIKNIIPQQIALSEKQGTATFLYNSLKPTMGKLENVEADYHVEDTTSITVNTNSIDNFIHTQKIIPKIIKIDVEGAGRVVLNGAHQTISKYAPSFFIELHGPEEQIGVQKKLLEKGYTIETLSGKKIIDVFKEWNSPLWCYK